ncbi:MAG: MCE family protein [Planctomycetes bacterium]|nr:MCE family protein [Planctomycetota bacterium]
MRARSRKSDLITGVFGAAVIAAVAFIVLFLQAWGPPVRGVRYSIMFKDVGGLGGNSPVLIAGQKVGKVDSINARPVVEGGRRTVEVEVGIVIDENFASIIEIPTDSQAQVQMSSFFGGSNLIVRLGKDRTMVKPGERLPVEGKPPVGLNELVESAYATIEKLRGGLDNLATVLNDKSLTDSIRASLLALQSTLEQFDKGMKEMGPALEKVGPTITSANALLLEMRTLIKTNNDNITGALSHFNSATRNADALLGGDVKFLVADLRSIADNMDKLVANMNDLVLDNQGNIAVSMQNIRESTESIRTFSKRIEANPSLLIWGSSEPAPAAGEAAPRKTRNVDEWSLRQSGRLPRREQD